MINARFGGVLRQQDEDCAGSRGWNTGEAVDSFAPEKKGKATPAMTMVQPLLRRRASRPRVPAMRMVQLRLRKRASRPRVLLTALFR